jgi:hypothetical protein
MYTGLGQDTITTLPNLTSGSANTVTTASYGSFSGSDIEAILQELDQEVTAKTTAQSTSTYLMWGLFGVGGVLLLMGMFGGHR